jgi:hypothetical protein
MGSEYEAEGAAFLSRFGFTLRAHPGDKAANWTPSGNHYEVEIFRTDRLEPLRFDYWGSAHDKDLNKAPSSYDILACLSTDSTIPEDPDEVAEELGPMPPSKAYECAAFGKRIREFFEAEELDALREIA